MSRKIVVRASAVIVLMAVIGWACWRWNNVPAPLSGWYEYHCRRKFTGGHIRYEIRSDEGKRAVRGWLRANGRRVYTRTLISALPDPLIWTDGNSEILYSLYTSMPSPWSRGRYKRIGEYVDHLPLEEIDKLRDIFKEHGTIVRPEEPKEE